MKKNKLNSDSSSPVNSGFNFNFNFNISKEEIDNIAEWLCRIPPCELSDTMLKIHNEMIENKHSKEWFKYTVIDKLPLEIESFLKWNKNILN